jgi:hypothetical protein
MKYVSQKHRNGCGVASLAMVTGIGYDRSMKILAPKRKPGSFYHGTTLEQTLRALTKLRIQYRMVFDHISFDRIKNPAYISFVQPCGCRHAVAWDPQTKKILDPDSGPDHSGKVVHYSKAFIQKHMNFIVEIIPS